MSWFFFALLSPVLHAAGNHIDKFLLSKYLKNSDSAVLIIFSSLFGLVVFPFIALFHPTVLQVDWKNATLLLICGIVFVLYLIPYFFALNRDEASIVAPLFQTVPIFGYIMAYFVLGESLSSRQILASILIITGAIILSLDIDEKRPKLKKEIFFAMLLSSFLLALGSLIFKFVAIKESFWVSSFWNYMGYSIVGICLLLFVKKYRINFIRLFKTNSIQIISINSLNEILFIVGTLGMTFASLLAPLALVLVVDSFQPFFVFVYGILITLFFTKIGKESLLKKHLIQKIFGIVVIFLGTFFLN